jgi:hypothetical protein
MIVRIGSERPSATCLSCAHVSDCFSPKLFLADAARLVLLFRAAAHILPQAHSQPRSESASRSLHRFVQT